MRHGDYEELLAQMSYEQDPRSPPDNYRRGRFRSGWRDATTRGKTYTDDTLRRLTWNNLGYRFGKILGSRPLAQIDGAYSSLALLYEENFFLPEEVSDDEQFVEGARRRISINAYERNPKARTKCIERYGAKCCICNFDFGEVYGEVARNYIHVHHLRPLYEIGAEYKVDVEDLRPVCPNCHAVLHRRRPAYSIEEVRAFL